MANPSHLTPAQLEKIRAQRHAPSQAPVHKSSVKVPASRNVADYQKLRTEHRLPSQAPAHKGVKTPTTHAAAEKILGKRHAPAQSKSLLRIPK